MTAAAVFAPRGLAGRAALNSRQGSRADVSSMTPEQVAALVAECGRRTTRMAARVFRYTYTEAAREYEVDKAGRSRVSSEKVYEVYPARRKGGYVVVQVSEDGVPLSAEKVERERERAAKSLAEAEDANAAAASSSTPTPTPAPNAPAAQGAAGPVKPAARYASYGIGVEQRRHGGLAKTVWSIRPTDFFTSHEFYAPARATYEGREAILLSFRPRAGFVYDATNVPFKDGAEEYARVMSRLGGRVWIDAEDKVVVRLEAFPSDELDRVRASSAPRDDAPVGFELARLADGTWVPERSWYDSFGREAFFWKTPLKRERRYSDFKKFKTEVNDVTLDAPPEPKP